MSDSHRSFRADRTLDPGRRRVVVFVVLLALTIAGGVTARVLGEATAVPGPGPGTSSTVVATAPDGSVRIDARLDRESVLQGEDGLVKLELAITGAANDPSIAPARMPTDLVVVLDRSGSMQGEPIVHALASVRRLVDTLDDDDRFALVTYASSSSTVISLAAATPAARDAWQTTISQVGVGGGTNMASGLDRGAAQIASARTPGRVARLVLVSDGHANEGDHSREGLLSRAARAIGDEYVVSAVGVGDGFDESLMTALADAGTGNFYYVRRGSDLGEIFAGEFASARAQLASALEVVIRPEPGVQVVSAAGYPLAARPDGVSFHPGSLFAGQERRVWVTLRMPTDTHIDAHDVGAVALHYTRGGVRRTLRVDGLPQVAVVVDAQQFLAGFSSDAWAASVAEDDLGALKQEVSSALQQNDTDAAMQKMRAFRVQQSAVNAAVQSPAVAELIADVAEMEETVGRAAESKDAGERNRLSKQYSAEGYDVRRPGAKYESK